MCIWHIAIFSCSVCSTAHCSHAASSLSPKSRPKKPLTNVPSHRGSYRPTLPSLIRQNAASSVHSTTQEALSKLQDNLSANTLCSDPAPPLDALTHLCTLRGVGPATASLILSCAAPSHVPFLGDQVYAWFHSGEKPTRYDAKEWRSLWTAVYALTRRFAAGTPDALALQSVSELVRAELVERAACVALWFALGRVDAGRECEEGEKGEKGIDKKSTKRKDTGAEDINGATKVPEKAKTGNAGTSRNTSSGESLGNARHVSPVRRSKRLKSTQSTGLE